MTMKSLLPAVAFLIVALSCAPKSDAATLSWTNTAGGTWSTPTNWSPNAVPANGDNLFITNNGTYTVDLNVSASPGTLVLGGTAGTQQLTVAATTLTLSNTNQVGTNGVFALAGGTLDGSDVLVVAGQFLWSGGTINSSSGGGRLIFTNSASVVITSGATKSVLRRSIDNHTTVVWNGGTINAGFSAVWNNGGVFDIAGDLNVSFIGGAPLTFNNDGQFRKVGGTGTASFQAYVVNHNFVSAQSGILSLDYGGSSNGRFDASGGTNNFGLSVHTLLAGAWFTGTGLHRVQGGIVEIAGVVTITNRFELGAGGTIEGTNTLILGGPVVWSGGTMDSSYGAGGRTVFTNSASVSITTGNLKSLSRRIVDNYTSVSWDGGTINGAFSAVWNNKSGASFDILADLFLSFTGGGPLTFNNDGQFRKVGGTGTASFQAYVVNHNFVSAQSGILSLDYGGSSNGRFDAAGGTNNFGLSVHTLLPGASFQHIGILSLEFHVDKLSRPLL